MLVVLPWLTVVTFEVFWLGRVVGVGLSCFTAVVIELSCLGGVVGATLSCLTRVALELPCFGGIVVVSLSGFTVEFVGVNPLFSVGDELPLLAPFLVGEGAALVRLVVVDTFPLSSFFVAFDEAFTPLKGSTVEFGCPSGGGVEKAGSFLSLGC